MEEKQYKFDSYLEAYEKLMNLIGDLSLQLKDCRRIISLLKKHLNFTITRNENRFDDVNYKLNFCGEKNGEDYVLITDAFCELLKEEL